MKAGSAENNIKKLSEIRQCRFCNSREIHKTEMRNTIRSLSTTLPTKYSLPQVMKATQLALSDE